MIKNTTQQQGNTVKLEDPCTPFEPVNLSKTCQELVKDKLSDYVKMAKSHKAMVRREELRRKEQDRIIEIATYEIRLLLSRIWQGVESYHPELIGKPLNITDDGVIQHGVYVEEGK